MANPPIWVPRGSLEQPAQPERRSIVVTLRRIDGLLALARANLPRQVKSTGEFTDWAVVAPALLGIATDLFEGVMSSLPPRSRVRAEVLARSLAEYAIGFAWLATPDEQQQTRRLKQLEKDEFLERQRAENKLADQIKQRAAYASNLARWGLPSDLLGDETRARVERLKAEDTPALPNAFDMAFAADRDWMPEIDLVARNPFAVIYFILFTGPSFMTHPSVSAVSRMAQGQPPDLVVGASEGLGESETPYGQALLTYANMLLVAARVLGWPDEDDIMSVLSQG